VSNLSAFIKESFGSNATYVEGLLERYRQDVNLVDESWQAYFSDLLNGTTPASSSETATPAPASAVTPTPTKAPVPVALSADTEAKPLTGVAKKIVENMEQSLTVPVATSFRNIPVKLLDENRRIVHETLASPGR